MNGWSRIGSVVLAIALLVGCSGDSSDDEQAGTDIADGASSGEAAAGPDTQELDPADGDAPASSGDDAGSTIGGLEPGTVGTTLLDPVAVGEEAPFGEGLVVRVTDIAARDLEAGGPGEVAGPGVVVSIEARNDASGPVDLLGFVLSAYYGEDREPAGEATGADHGNALSGILAPGDTTRGEYAFFVPDGESPITIEAHHIESESIVVIEH